MKAALGARGSSQAIEIACAHLPLSEGISARSLPCSLLKLLNTWCARSVAPYPYTLRGALGARRERDPGRVRRGDASPEKWRWCDDDPGG